MKTRIVQNVNHSISAGAISFRSVKAKGRFHNIQIDYEGLDTDDVIVSVRQSQNDRQFNIITNASKLLDSALPSHTFSVIDLPTDELLIELDPGTATTGIIKTIIWMLE